MHALGNLVGRTYPMVALIIINAFALCNLVGRKYLKVTLIIIIELSLSNLVGRTYLMVTLTISLHLLSVNSWVVNIIFGVELVFDKLVYRFV